MCFRSWKCTVSVFRWNHTNHSSWKNSFKKIFLQDFPKKNLLTRLRHLKSKISLFLPKSIGLLNLSQKATPLHSHVLPKERYGPSPNTALNHHKTTNPLPFPLLAEHLPTASTKLTLTANHPSPSFNPIPRY